MKVPVSVLCLSLLAAPVLAEPMTGKAAAKLMYRGEGAVVQMLDGAGLPEADVTALTMVGTGQPWYGAIAISPDEGLMVEATVAAVNHHTVGAAETAARQGCDAKRKGKAACVVVAHLLPKGWKPADLTLSQDATAALRKEYKAPGALAISPSTGSFALTKGEAAGDLAVQACNEKAGTKDCIVAVQD